MALGDAVLNGVAERFWSELRMDGEAREGRNDRHAESKMNALIMAFPYVCTLLAAGCFAALRGDQPAVWIALIAIAGAAAFVAALIAAVRNAVRGLTAKQNLTIKCVQIPAYAMNFAIAIIGVMMSVFGLPMIAWAIGCGRTLYKEGKIDRTAAIWTTIGSFAYCVDVVIAIVWYCKGKK